MTSKWIQKLTQSIFNIGKGLPVEESPNEIVERIDKLLREAMNETDNENLHDKIEEELE